MKKTIAMPIMILAAGGLALAQPKAPDPKKPDAPKAPEKAPEAKKEAPKEIKAPEPKAPEMKPPAEVAAMATMMGGNWKCAGKGAMDPANPANMVEFKGTYKAALDMDKYYVKGDWSSTVGKMKMRGTMWMTYDATAKKWYRHAVDNMGAGGMESSTGLPAGAKEGKMVWEGDSHMPGMMMKTRTTEEIAAKSVKITAEMSMDGKKWMTGMEMTCTK